jgi:hypothetical protein
VTAPAALALAVRLEARVRPDDRHAAVTEIVGTSGLEAALARCDGRSGEVLGATG